MGAHEWISPDQLKSMFGEDMYHGTHIEDFEPGEHIDPSYSGSAHGGQAGHTYFTSDWNTAKQYADAASRNYGGYPSVYKVEPTGPARDDDAPMGLAEGAYMSKHPLRIVKNDTFED